jgi:hypothetical protein
VYEERMASKYEEVAFEVAKLVSEKQIFFALKQDTW